MITGDFETKSYADLKKVGAWVYSEDATTEIICFCYGIDDQPIQSWWPGKPGVKLVQGMPADLYMAIMLGHHFEAHNVSFERSIWTNIMMKRFGWVEILPHQWRDTAAVARYYGLPAGLDKLAHALGYEGKDPAGSKLITKYCKLHLKTAKTVIPPEDFEKFVAYCIKDVEIEQSISDYLGDLPDREIPVFLLDQEMNLRGLRLDQEGIENATAVVEERSEELNAKFEELVGIAPTKIAKCMEWFREQGLDEEVLPDLRADTIDELLEEGRLGQCPARKALELRREVAKASTKKLATMARQSGKDGRARYQQIYHGAGTGRNTGTGFQPLNLNRGYDAEKTGYTPEQVVRDIGYRNPAFLDALYGDAMDCVAKASRHWIMADDGKIIRSGDFVSVEAVILACLAGEEWKVQAFREKKAIYALAACNIHGIDIAEAEKGDKYFKANYGDQRQDGKTGELAFGYQGALNAWLKFDSSGRHSDEAIIGFVRGWRRGHPMTTLFWRKMEECAIAAVDNPGSVQSYRQIGFQTVDEWLTMILPDGKRLWYFKPELRMGMPPWHKPKANPDCAEGTCDCQPRPFLTYMAWKFGQWRRVSTYGGKLTENAVQATSRQALVPATLALKEAGYNLIMTVYDEIVTEDDEGFGSIEEFTEIMRRCPGKWAEGWPINVDVWQGRRYKK